MKEYLDRIEAAECRLNWATDQGEIDAAIYELKSAEVSLSNFFRREQEKEEKRDFV